GGRHLAGSGAAKPLVVSQVDEAETSPAQYPFDPVAPDPLGQREVRRDGWGCLRSRQVHGRVRLAHDPGSWPGLRGGASHPKVYQDVPGFSTGAPPSITPAAVADGTARAGPGHAGRGEPVAEHPRPGEDDPPGYGPRTPGRPAGTPPSVPVPRPAAGATTGPAPCG